MLALTSRPVVRHHAGVRLSLADQRVLQGGELLGGARLAHVALDQALRRLAVGVLAEPFPLGVVLELGADPVRPRVEQDLVHADRDHLAQDRLAGGPGQPRDLVLLRRHLVEIRQQLRDPRRALGFGDLGHGTPRVAISTAAPRRVRGPPYAAWVSAARTAIDELVARVQRRAADLDADPRDALARVLAALDVAPGDPAWADGRDVVGEAYEALVPTASRRTLGQFFTPLWAARPMAEWLLARAGRSAARSRLRLRLAADRRRAGARRRAHAPARPRHRSPGPARWRRQHGTCAAIDALELRQANFLLDDAARAPAGRHLQPAVHPPPGRRRRPEGGDPRRPRPRAWAASSASSRPCTCSSCCARWRSRPTTPASPSSRPLTGST